MKNITAIALATTLAFAGTAGAANYDWATKAEIESALTLSVSYVDPQTFDGDDMTMNLGDLTQAIGQNPALHAYLDNAGVEITDIIAVAKVTDTDLRVFVDMDEQFES